MNRWFDVLNKINLLIVGGGLLITTLSGCEKGTLTSSEHEHVFITLEGRKPTCEENGLSDKVYCNECGYVLHESEVIKAGGHNIVETSSKEPSFAEYGYSHGAYCSKCGEVYTESIIIPKLEYTDYAFSAYFDFNPNLFTIDVYGDKRGKTLTKLEDLGELVWSKNGDTGELSKEDGQFNFSIRSHFDKYLYDVDVSGDYKNLKQVDDNEYRITKVSSNIVIRITPYLKTTPLVSLPSGFYDEGETLSISSDYDVYYTIDGENPNSNSFKYIHPITLEDASLSTNRNSMLQTTTPGFLTDLIEKYASINPNYKTPSTLIDKCHVFKVVAVDEFGVSSKIVSNTYFVGFDNKEYYSNTGFISLVTPPDNLFDDEIGIYVMGNNFSEDKFKNAWYSQYYWWWPGNYSLKGKEYERTANLTFFDDDKVLELQKECGIRIHGGGTRGIIEKSLNLYSREEYDGVDRFNYDFFGTGYNPKRLVLSQGGDDSNCKISDHIVSSLYKSSKCSNPNSKRYCLFINGEFWGYYYLTEKYDDVYFDYYNGIQEDNIIYVKSGAIEEGNESDLKTVKADMKFLTSLDLTDDNNYKTALDMVDIDSMVDYYALMIYINRSGDWHFYGSNYALFRSREKGNGLCEDTKYRLAIFDLNSGTFEDSQNDSIIYTRGVDALFNNFYKNATFRSLLIHRIHNIANEDFNDDNVSAFLENFINYQIQSKNEGLRFYDDPSYGEVLFSNRLNQVKNFLAERSQFVFDSWTVN